MDGETEDRTVFDVLRIKDRGPNEVMVEIGRGQAGDTYPRFVLRQLGNLGRTEMCPDLYRLVVTGSDESPVTCDSVGQALTADGSFKIS